MKKRRVARGFSASFFEYVSFVFLGLEPFRFPTTATQQTRSNRDSESKIWQLQKAATGLFVFFSLTLSSSSSAQSFASDSSFSRASALGFRSSPQFIPPPPPLSLTSCATSTSSLPPPLSSSAFASLLSLSSAAFAPAASDSSSPAPH